MGWYGDVWDGMGLWDGYGMVWEGTGWYWMVWDGMAQLGMDRLSDLIKRE